MERLTRDGLERLVAALTERIGDPRIPPTTAGPGSLRRTVAHAIRSVEAYLDLGTEPPGGPVRDAVRQQAEELWVMLERAACLPDRPSGFPDDRTAPPPRNARRQSAPPDGPSSSRSSRPTATLTAVRAGRLLVLRPAGELDLQSADLFQEMSSEEVTAILLDLSRVGFCDSEGLNALLRLHAEAEGQGVLLHLVAPTRQVTRVLEITGTDKVFSVHHSIDDAMAALTNG